MLGLGHRVLEAILHSSAMRPVLYQLVPRHFGNENLTRRKDGTLEQNGVGKFSDINDDAARMLLDLGVTHVWLTGVLRQATLTDWSSIGLPADPPDIVKGRAGSFYAIRDYYDVCPDYAEEPENRMAEFEALIARLHRHGLKALIDLVPNHVARSYGSSIYPERDFGRDDDRTVFFSPKNDFFYLIDPPGRALRLQKPAHWNPPGVEFRGGFEREDGGPGRPPRATGNNGTSPSPSPDDWYETIKLNYGYNFADPASSSYEPRPPSWGRVDAILAYWQGKGVDGFRCDFAHYVPNEAWSWLLARVKQRDPNSLVIAEAYEDLRGLLGAGFDAVYHDEAYDHLKELYQGHRSLDEVDALLRDLPAEERPRLVHYLENHDERRIASPLVRDGGPDATGFGTAAAARQVGPVLYLASSGPVLVYNGQEVGEDGAGDEGFGGEDGRTSIFDYWGGFSLAGLCNGKRWDGGQLSPESSSLRAYYRELLALCQDPSVMGSGYWGLRYVNRAFPWLLAYARYAPGSGRLLCVVANFQPTGDLRGAVTLPMELLKAAGISERARWRWVLTEQGIPPQETEEITDRQLVETGVPVALPGQSARVFAVESAPGMSGAP